MDQIEKNTNSCNRFLKLPKSLATSLNPLVVRANYFKNIGTKLKFLKRSIWFLYFWNNCPAVRRVSDVPHHLTHPLRWFTSDETSAIVTTSLACVMHMQFSGTGGQFWRFLHKWCPFSFEVQIMGQKHVNLMHLGWQICSLNVTNSKNYVTITSIFLPHPITTTYSTLK